MVNKEQMKAYSTKKLIWSILEISSPGSFLRPAFSKAAEVEHLFPTVLYALGEVPVNTLGTGKKKRKQSTA